MVDFPASLEVPKIEICLMLICLSIKSGSQKGVAYGIIRYFYDQRSGQMQATLYVLYMIKSDIHMKKHAK